ncbi:MAG TPA: ATP-binding cassette domain-containing protein [Candidatus Pelethocola excrementipullorum]|nr:ATP-binding cassette domain-containing protein [Candidatus Pelethocola excrementipullorum]
MRLEVKNIRKSFGDKEVLHGISFAVESGSALGLLGRNGAGKTTTIRILMDVFKGDEGQVLLDGVRFNPKKLGIGYLPEERGLYPKKKVGEQIIYLAQLRGMGPKEAKESMKKWLARLEVSEYENRQLETLSKGNQQKVQLAQTLVCNPQIIILDEPFSGLDPVNSQVLKDVILEEIQNGKLVIFSSHQMSYVEEFCKDIIIINKGNTVLSGDLRNIKREYGKNRLVLSVSDMGHSELRRIADEKFGHLITVYGNNKEQLILEMKPGATKQAIMVALIESGLDVETFGSYQPSLNDIFVERAGD